jgi:hypothetical protein
VAFGKLRIFNKHAVKVSEALSREIGGRDERGRRFTFVDNVKSELGFKAMHRTVMEVTGTYTLREEGEPYSASFTAALRPENTIFRHETLRSLRL